ncbi:MAG: hypothetical protein WBL93_01615 [Lutisporaceae bacterium]
MKHYYCSAFSGAYSYQGLVLYDSLKKHDNLFTVFYVCLDNTAFEILSTLRSENIVVIKVEQIEAYFEELKSIKDTRAIHEYAWTIKSSEMLYILEKYKEVDKIIWLDGDTQMLSNPEVIFDEWGNYSVLLTEQYYTDNHESLINQYGKFQAGFVGFKRDNAGIKALSWWRKKCIDWCYSKFEKGRWADQKYLDKIPELFPNVCIVKNLGINMTPFILYRFNFEQQKYLEVRKDELYVNNIRLVLFHYYGFRYFDDSTYDLCSYWMKYTRSTVELLYKPYIESCKAVIEEIEAIKTDYKLLWKNIDRCISCNFDLLRSNNSAYLDIATIIDKNTVQEGLAQYYSLEEHCHSFYWWVCCMDIYSFDVMKSLKLPNTTVTYIGNVVNGVFKNQISVKLERNIIERIKAYFFHYLLKNNYSINRLLYLDSGFYLFGDVTDAFNNIYDYKALLFTQYAKGRSMLSINFDFDIVGLINCKETVDFLQFCIDRPKGIFNLNHMISKYLYAFTVGTTEYNCSLDDIKYNKLQMRNGRIYIYQSPLRAFNFNKNEGLKGSNINANRRVKHYIYNQIYEPYNKALARAMLAVKGIGEVRK